MKRRNPVEYTVRPRLAPEACVVCWKAFPEEGETVPGWTYLSGSLPLGAMTCSESCLAVALERHRTTGRVDAPLKVT